MRVREGLERFKKILLTTGMKYFLLFFFSYCYTLSAIPGFDGNITYCCQLIQSAPLIWKHILWLDPKLAQNDVAALIS